MKSRALAVIAAAVFGVCGSAHAAFAVFTSQSSFLAQLSNPGVDTFDDLSKSLLPDTLSRTAGSYTYSASVGPLSDFFPGGAGADVWLASDNRFDTIQFSNFASAVRGVGGFFFGTDQNGALTATPVSIALRATDAAGSTSQLLVNPTNTSFLGFVSDRAITSLEVFVSAATASGPNVWPTVNNLTLGVASVSAVPEPETSALMLMGLAFLGTAFRRRATRR
jgi:hypothetical protein